MIRNPVLAWSIAAIAAVSTVLVGQRYLSARAELTLLRDQRTLADVALKTAQAQIESEQILTRGLIEHAKVSATPDTTAAASSPEKSDPLTAIMLRPTRGTNVTESAVAVCDAVSRRGLLVASALPANTPEDRYVLWFAGAQPVRLAEFRRSSEGPTQVAFALPATPAGAPMRLLVSRETTAGVATAPSTILFATD